jgi:RNA polymerase sigma-70 factor (ECF subfamily)
MLNQAELSSAIRRHADTVRRVCAVYSTLNSDAEDIFQEVFLKFATHPHRFESTDHEKYWLIRVTMNTCKDLLKSARLRRSSPSDRVPEPALVEPDDNSEVLAAVRALGSPLREAVYLHYYEGYPAAEIADLLGTRPNTVYTWLAKARRTLEEVLR